MRAFRSRTAYVGLLAGLASLAAGCRHVPTESTTSTPPKTRLGRPVATGMASYYGPGFNGRRTANGERFNQRALTAAHRSLPFGTCLHVVNLENERSVEVRVNDRGPYVAGRVLDLSLGAAQRLDMLDTGIARVRIYLCTDDEGDSSTS